MQLAAEARSKARFARAAAEGKRLTSSSGENEGVSPPSLTIVRAALAAHCPLSYFLRSRGAARRVSRWQLASAWGPS